MKQKSPLMVHKVVKRAKHLEADLIKANQQLDHLSVLLSDALQRERQLQEQNQKYRERLELVNKWVYDDKECITSTPLTEAEVEYWPDGITARDETIKLLTGILNRNIKYAEKLKKKIKKLEGG